MTIKFQTRLHQCGTLLFAMAAFGSACSPSTALSAQETSTTQAAPQTIPATSTTNLDSLPEESGSGTLTPEDLGPVDVSAEPSPTGKSIEVYGTVVGSGSSEVVKLEYMALVEQRWSLEIGAVWLQPATFVADGVDAMPLVAVEIDFDYYGDSPSGQLLDLVMELETEAGVVSAVHQPCRPAPTGTIDVFRSVKIDEQLSGLVCFATDSAPVALLITPLVAPQIRIPIG